VVKAVRVVKAARAVPLLTPSPRVKVAKVRVDRAVQLPVPSPEVKVVKAARALQLLVLNPRVKVVKVKVASLRVRPLQAHLKVSPRVRVDRAVQLPVLSPRAKALLLREAKVSLKHHPPRHPSPRVDRVNLKVDKASPRAAAAAKVTVSRHSVQASR